MSFYGSRYFGDIIYGEVGKSLFEYHGYVMIVIVGVLVFVIYMGCVILITKRSYRHFLNRQRLEFWWTVVPMLLLILLWFPSMINLYHIEEVKRPRWNFKAIGKQWYWSYEFCRNLDTPGFNKSAEGISCYTIDSYIESPQDTFIKNGYRLLDVDNRIVAPAGVQITAFVSRSDVLHSFALPKLLIKVDAIPGRINRLPMKASQCSIIYGQCSEICGVNHRFMPIVIEFIPEKYFVIWLEALN